MKHRFTILFIYILSLGLMSCESDRLNTGPDDSGEWVQIALQAAGKGSPSSGTDPDYEVNTLRILAFQATSGQLKYNSGKINLSSTPLPLTLEIMSGRYHFVFIANEHSVEDHLLTASLDQWTPGSSKVITSLDTETFPYNAFSTDKDLPATSIYKNVTVSTDSQLTYYDTYTNTPVIIHNVANQPWDVEVERLAVRLDIQLLVDEKYRGDITGIYFANLPDRVPFFHHTLSGNSVNCYEGGYAETYPLSYIPVRDFTISGPDANGRYIYSRERIILPASVFPDIANEAKAITIEVHTSSAPEQPLRQALGQAVPTDYTSPRNLYYKIEGNIHEEQKEPVRLLFIAVVDDWTIENIQDNTNTETKKLNVERLAVPISRNETTRIHFWSDQPTVTVSETGYTGTSGETTFTVNDYLDNLAGTAATNLHYNPLTGTGYIDIQQKQGVTPPAETLRIHLDAAGLKRELTLQINN